MSVNDCTVGVKNRSHADNFAGVDSWLSIKKNSKPRIIIRELEYADQ